jgi:tetratricopeptide (TPR) repeat protein
MKQSLLSRLLILVVVLFSMAAPCFQSISSAKEENWREYEEHGDEAKTAGEWSKAEAAYRMAMGLINNTHQMDIRVAELSTKLGEMFIEKMDLKSAEGAFRRALSIYQWNLGPDDVKVADTLDRVAGSLQNQENGFALTGPLYFRSLAIREKVLGPDHPDVADSLQRVGLALYFENGRLPTAIPLLERALNIREKTSGHEHLSVATILSTLAFIYDLHNARDSAIPLYEEALSIQEKILGPDAPEVLQSLYNLGMAYRLEHAYEKAGDVFERRLKAVEGKFGPDDPEVVSTLELYDSVLREAGKEEDAKVLSDRVQQIRARAKGQTPPKN